MIDKQCSTDHFIEKSLISMRNSEQYDEMFAKCLKICKECDIEIPEVKKRKVFIKVDSTKNQHQCLCQIQKD